MILNQPEIISHEDSVIYFSRIESPASSHLPEHIWYILPEKYQSFLLPNSDAFLLPALLAAMTMGENLHVQGNISSRLVYNLAEYQHLLCLRLGEPLRKVRITFEDAFSEITSGGKVGTLFSGGLDGLFTLHEHLPETQSNPEYCVSHAIYINGFDILNQHMPVYTKLFSEFQEHLDQIDVELVPDANEYFQHDPWQAGLFPGLWANDR